MFSKWGKTESSPGETLITRAPCGAGALKGLVIDMGILIEGRSREELPEQLLGTVRMSHLDLSKVRRLHMCPQPMALRCWGLFFQVVASSRCMVIGSSSTTSFTRKG